MLLRLTPGPLENEWQYIYVFGSILVVSSLFKLVYLMVYSKKRPKDPQNCTCCCGKRQKRSSQRGPAASSQGKDGTL